MRELLLTLTSDSWAGCKGEKYRWFFNGKVIKDSEVVPCILDYMGDVYDYTMSFTDVLGPLTSDQRFWSKPQNNDGVIPFDGAFRLIEM